MVDCLETVGYQQSALGWLIIVLIPCLLISIGIYLFGLAHPIVKLALHLCILYLTVNFYGFTDYYNRIQLALSRADLSSAQKILQSWKLETKQSVNTENFSISAVCRAAIEELISVSHRHLFAIVLAYTLLPGVFGPLLYCFSEYLLRDTQAWKNDPNLQINTVRKLHQNLNHFAERVFNYLDWVPVRCTAVLFAIVGNFEDAIYGWRRRSVLWNNKSQGILLESAAGALGVCLGPPEIIEDIDAPGAAPGPHTLQSASALVWRAVIVWLILMFLLNIWWH